jgi:CDP-diacylglycerol--glycerol-3-phosphate 3-phosphatidyltransferase
MLTERARRLSSGVVEPVVGALARTSVSPDGLTLLGLAAHVPTAWLIAQGHLRAGAVLLALAAAVDGLDGALARRTERTSRYGAFLDSTCDRVSEVWVFAGLLLYAQRRMPAYGPVLVLVSLAGSLMVSYTRARSEARGCGTKAGVLGRLERMVVLVVGLLSGWVEPALWVLAVGTWLTTAQRIVDVRRRTRQELTP